MGILEISFLVMLMCFSILLGASEGYYIRKNTSLKTLKYIRISFVTSVIIFYNNFNN